MVNVNDLENLSKPVTVLIEKISDAIGASFKPSHIENVAKAEAKATVIHARAKAEADIIHAQAEVKINEIEKRGLRRMIRLQGIKQQNIEQIIVEATKLINENANPKAMENDWIINFFDKCELVSDKEMQEVWAKILSGEANKPGSYSKRTINILSSIEKSQAELFTTLCRFKCNVNGHTEILFSPSDDICKKNGLTDDELCNLQAMGLIRFSDMVVYTLTNLPNEFQVDYFGISLKAKLEKNGSEMCTGSVKLTSVGQELSSICASQPVDGFTEYMKETWSRHTNKVTFTN